MDWLFALATLAIAPGMAYAEAPSVATLPPLTLAAAAQPHARELPFYSQFSDIAAPSWRKVGCGIASLTMIIDYYHPEAVSVNTLLKKGIAAGAYDKNAGWIYSGLIGLSRSYGLTGKAVDLASLSSSAALTKLTDALEQGPVMVSVHYKFDPKSRIPHLVVIESIKGDTVYYNDPAAKSGHRSLSVEAFSRGWKKRMIVFRPMSVASAGTNLRDRAGESAQI